MIRFESDYLEGTHERILRRLMDTNLEQTCGYGEDVYCEMARGRIQEACGTSEAYVQFLVGGTQTNTVVIAAALRPHQGVIAAQSGHINTHESGAIEAAGHKVLVAPGIDGKLTEEEVKRIWMEHAEDSNREHTVQPKMVYISNPTEIGTIYSKKELEALSHVCRECGLYLYMDGARLGYGLTARGNDLTLEDIARCCHVFYIGGTKVGALFGEAVVITDKSLMSDFRYLIKQRGGMLAKGRLLGVQFDELFTNGLYFELGARGNRMAEILRNAFLQHGCGFLVETETNQLFPILEDRELERLMETYSFSYWERVDECHSAVRFCTSWATREEDIETFAKDLTQLGRG